MAATPSAAGSATPGGNPLGVAQRRIHEDVIKVLLFLAALLSVLTTVGIVISLLTETLSFLGEVPLDDFLFGTDWSPLFAKPSFGVLPLVSATLLVSAIALAVAVPLGLGAAIYLSEYATPRTRKTFKPILELLAGVPTIVFGYFALTWFTPNVLNDLLGLGVPVFNALSGGIIMGFMVVPTIASVSEDAMSAVPSALREGSYGLGANKLQTSMRVVFPAALSGIVAAIVLGASRAIGETMIAVVAVGLLPNLSANATEPMATITAFIASTAKGDIAHGSIAYQTIFAVGMTLFIMTFVMNIIAIRFVRRFRQEYE